MEDLLNTLGVFALLVAAIYFLPSLIALSRGRRQAAAIVALNLLLGWTFVGWAVAFVWALCYDGPPRPSYLQRQKVWREEALNAYRAERGL